MLKRKLLSCLDSNNVTGVSRSGRIRKKSSKLIYFDSNFRLNEVKRKKVSKFQQKSTECKQTTENINAKCQTEIFNQVLCCGSNSMKSKSNTNDTQQNNFETDLSLTVMTDELLSPNYTSYNEDSADSYEKLLMPVYYSSGPHRSIENYSNMLLKTKTNLCSQV